MPVTAATRSAVLVVLSQELLHPGLVRPARPPELRQALEIPFAGCARDEMDEHRRRAGLVPERVDPTWRHMDEVPGAGVDPSLAGVDANRPLEHEERLG